MKQGHRLKTGAEHVRKSTLIIAVQELALLHSRSFRRNEDCSFSGKIRSAVELSPHASIRLPLDVLFWSLVKCQRLVELRTETVTLF